jgi:hypothetical protein
MPNPTAEFREAISEPWLSLEPVRVGKPPSGLGTPDVYVIVDAGETLLRIDVYSPGDERCAPFQEVLIWGDLVVIGFGHHAFLVPLHGGQPGTIDVGSYFGHLYAKDDVLIVASESRLFRIARNGELIWTSPEVGIDGVEVDRIEDGVVYGQGEWDPPGGWKPFVVRLDAGERVS